MPLKILERRNVINVFRGLSQLGIAFAGDSTPELEVISLAESANHEQ